MNCKNDMNEKGIIVIISGFSGAGKGTLVKGILERSDQLVLSVSVTTRAPREGEVEGVDYFYITHERFDKMVENGELLEHAEYVGNGYGTPKAFVDEMMESGKDVILEIDIQGAMQIRELYPDALLIFVIPPSVEELANRLRKRGTEDEETIRNRLIRAADEADGVENYDCILLNDDLEEAVETLLDVIANRLRDQKQHMDLVDQINHDLDMIAKGEE